MKIPFPWKISPRRSITRSPSTTRRRSCRGANAASPTFSALNPNGGQRGAEVDVTFNGSRLGDAKGVLCYTPGIEIGDVKVVNDSSFTAKVKIPADCPLGEHPMRLWTATGL